QRRIKRVQGISGFSGLATATVIAFLSMLGFLLGLLLCRFGFSYFSLPLVSGSSGGRLGRSSIQEPPFRSK
ncbi:MAG: hypothetical protein FWD53_00255, partial [Phycisphaerales bacterium]|nr:hypothetical protein [Phycisphaerales bacterium]